jgi:hypothetical protein
MKMVNHDKVIDLEKKSEELKQQLEQVNKIRIDTLNYAEELKQQMLRLQGAIQILEELQEGDSNVSNENEN